MTSTIDRILCHAQFLARHMKHCDLRYVTVAVLIELGVPTKNAAFDYLQYAVLLFHENPSRLITKGIYPEVGKLFEPRIGAWQIEQAIRRAINRAWTNRDEKVWGCYFLPDADGNYSKPTNAEFISRIARFLDLWQGCGEGVDHEE